MIKEIALEFKVNKQIKIKFLLLLFRLSKLRRKNILFSILFFPFHFLYHFYSQYFISLEMPIDTNVESPIIIWHGSGVVINPSATIGKWVELRNGVVIGNDGVNDKCPVICNSVSIGANAVIIGDITINDRAKIGPCSFVNFNVESSEKVINCTVRK
ncbi:MULTISPECIES: hypothetical protein [Vibrio]|uniref:hypothetical protein n=1 Tax=Vibrio TaxID=662 RepID=UPI0006ACEF5E|nr:MULTISPECIES: hypothetical protein [Vibrio]MCR9308424.1 hypothetical protein [Vibrio diabolicus]MDU9594132.1 hypothetical protein [Vibrio sp. 2-1-2a]MDU9603072.1 hypothetical protein [Vibrio sp. 1-2-3a]